MSTFQAEFETLREKFRQRLRTYGERLTEIRQSLAASPDADAIKRLRGLAHDLVGAAGTFGYPEIGELALELENAADEVIAGREEPLVVVAPLRQLLREVELYR